MATAEPDELSDTDHDDPADETYRYTVGQGVEYVTKYGGIARSVIEAVDYVSGKQPYILETGERVGAAVLQPMGAAREYTQGQRVVVQLRDNEAFGLDAGRYNARVVSVSGDVVFVDLEHGSWGSHQLWANPNVIELADDAAKSSEQ